MLALDKAGLMIILDNHMSNSDWCCSDTDGFLPPPPLWLLCLTHIVFCHQGNGLWYNKDYQESIWLQTMQQVLRRYKNLNMVRPTDILQNGHLTIL